MDQGIYAKWGLDPEIKVYPSGAPIVQAAATNEWDVAHIGAPPTIQGYKLGLIVAGVISEEAIMHQLIGRPDWVDAAKKDPSKIKGAKAAAAPAAPPPAPADARAAPPSAAPSPPRTGRAL